MTLEDGETDLATHLQALGEAAYATAKATTRKSALYTLGSLAKYLEGAGVLQLSGLSREHLRLWQHGKPRAQQIGAESTVRKALRCAPVASVHPSLVYQGAVGWSNRNSNEAVFLDRGNSRGWVDPLKYPEVQGVARSLAAFLVRVPVGTGAGMVAAYTTSLRKFLHWLNEQPNPPAALEWVTADHLDTWVAMLRTSHPQAAYGYGARLRDLLTNRPAGVPLHASLLAPDGQTCTWQPDAEKVTSVSADLAFSTLVMLRDVATQELREALIRVSAAESVAQRGCDPRGDAAAWEEQANVWWLAREGLLSPEAIEEALDADPAAWPEFLRAVLPSEKRWGRSWAELASRAVYAEIFPTELEVVGAYVLMLLATGLPPESVSTLQDEWFLVPRREDGRYAPVGRIRYEKNRAGSPRPPLLFTTRHPESPVRVRDRALRLTAGLRKLAAEELQPRLWLVLAPRPHSGRDEFRVSTLDQIVIPGVSGQRARTSALSTWVSHHGLDDPARVAALNEERRARHETRTVRRDHRVRARAQELGRAVAVPELAGFREYTSWTGPITPQRVRKTVRTRDITLHGPHGGARDHLVATLLTHYTRSETLRVIAAGAVRDAQAGLVSFASDAAPMLLVARGDEDLQALADLLELQPQEVEQLLQGDTQLMRNGLVCTNPTAPPPSHELSEDGCCVYLGSAVCASCPLALGVPAGVPALREELQRVERRSHIHVEGTVALEQGRHHERITILLQLLAPADRVSPPEPKPVTSAAPPRRRRRA